MTASVPILLTLAGAIFVGYLILDWMSLPKSDQRKLKKLCKEIDASRNKTKD